MGKRRKTKVSATSSYQKASSDDESSIIDGGIYDEVDVFHLDKSKDIIKGKRPWEDEVSDEEVLGVDVASEPDDNNEDYDMDEEGAESWGTRKKNYYGGDYAGDELHAISAQEREDLDLEEEATAAVQKRLTNELDEDSFAIGRIMSLTDYNKFLEKTSVHEVEKVSVDIDNLTDQQKKEILHRDAPEVPGILSDFIYKLDGSIKWMEGVMKSSVKSIPESHVSEAFKIRLITTYSCIVPMFLTLKTSRCNLHTHPLSKHLLGLQHIFQQAGIATISKDVSDLTSVAAELDKAISSTTFGEESQRVLSKIVMEEDQTNKDDDSDDSMDQEKRAASKLIVKNQTKGAKKHKEKRNPRMKHRTQFRKAIIRRKGQVPSLKLQQKKYTGESTGIRIQVAKGVKLNKFIL